MLRILGEGIAPDPADALARLRFAERRGVAPARRYREALERRETSRGPVREPDRPLLRFVQSGLARQGDWPGRVEGEDGEALRAALMAFARRERLGAADPFAPVVLDRLRDRWPTGA